MVSRPDGFGLYVHVSANLYTMLVQFSILECTVRPRWVAPSDIVTVTVFHNTRFKPAGLLPSVLPIPSELKTGNNRWYKALCTLSLRAQWREIISLCNDDNSKREGHWPLWWKPRCIYGVHHLCSPDGRLLWLAESPHLAKCLVEAKAGFIRVRHHWNTA